MSKIKAFAERIERLHDERNQLADDVRDIYTEAKDQQVNVKALKAAIAYRRKHRKDPVAAEKLEEQVHQYLFEIEHGTVPALRACAHEPVISAPKIEPAPVEQPAPPGVQATSIRPVVTPDAFRAAAAVEAQHLDLSERDGIPAFLDRRVG